MKKTISTILVPYDGTGSSDKAFKNVLEIAKRNEASIILYSCLKEKFSFGFFKTQGDKEIIKKQKAAMAKKMDALKKIAEKENIPVKSKILVCDFASESIIDYAKENKVDLIAMSKSKLATRAEQLYYDSTVERVFKHTPCSFLFIK